MGEKMEGNLNFGLFHPEKGDYFCRFVGTRWCPMQFGDASGPYVVPGGFQVLPGGCLVVIQGWAKVGFPGSVNIRWKIYVLLPAAGSRTQFFLLIFTEPGKHTLAHPCRVKMNI